MTRRDRLALQLALTHLRDADTDHGLTWAYCALTCGGELSETITAALDAVTRARDPVDNRLLRARLALLLRVLLRAEEEESSATNGGAGVGCEWTTCVACGGCGELPERSCFPCKGHGLISHPVRVVPLWQQGARKAGAA